MQFAGSHILSVEQFARGDVERIFAVADRMEPYAHRRRVTRVLDGAILGSMFFEPSTRTRVSFGSAFNLLGGEVRETTGFEHSAIAKGESLYDTARVLSGYSDVIAMRHPAAGSVAEFAAAIFEGFVEEAVSFEELSLTTTVWGGRNALLREYLITYPGDPDTYHGRHYYLVDRSNLYILIFQVTEGAYAEFTPELDAIAASFALLP